LRKKVIFNPKDYLVSRKINKNFEEDESERIVETEHFLVSFIFEGPLSAHSKLRTKRNEEK
jgi:hypothetical protein